MSNDSINTQTLLFGRDNEINRVMDIVNSNHSITLITGESGVGKTKFLDKIAQLLNRESKFMVGYYDKAIATPQSFIFPFSDVLASLLVSIRNSQSLGDKVDENLSRLKKAFVVLAKEEGKNLAMAILEDAAKKAGLEQTFKISKGFWDKFKKQKSTVMLVEEFVTKYRDETLYSFVELFETIVTIFRDKSIVLIFDQLEYMGKSAIDFLLEFLNILPERIHVLLAFRNIDQNLNNAFASQLFDETRDKIVTRLHGNEIPLKGLEAKSIGEWIEALTKKHLPMIPHLQRIKENTAGLPIVIEEWILNSPNLDYKEIDRENICSQILKLEGGLSKEILPKVYKLSIIGEALTEEDIAEYLNDDYDNVLTLIKELEKAKIFDMKTKWFRHELIQKCFEDYLSKDRKKKYHLEATQFYKNRLKILNISQNLESPIDSNNFAYGYHLANSHIHFEETYNVNHILAIRLSLTSNLDKAERFYARAMYAAKKLNRLDLQMAVLSNLTARVYAVWGLSQKAFTSYRTLKKYYHGTGQFGKEGDILIEIGKLYEKKDNYEKALSFYLKSLNLFKILGDHEGISFSLNQIGTYYAKMDKLDKALKYYKRSIKIKRKTGNSTGISNTLNNIGIIYERKLEFDKALKYFRKSLKIDRKEGDEQGRAETLSNIGVVYAKQHQYSKALKRFDKSLQLFTSFGNRDKEASTLYNIGNLYNELGNTGLAKYYYTRSLRIYKELYLKRKINELNQKLDDIEMLKVE